MGNLRQLQSVAGVLNFRGAEKNDQHIQSSIYCVQNHYIISSTERNIISVQAIIQCKGILGVECNYSRKRISVFRL